MRTLISVLFVLLLCASLPLSAEQFQRLGDLNVHYAVLNTRFLDPQIADTYRIVRAKDRALVNISLIDAQGNAVTANLDGSVTNLLGQVQPLIFRLIEEDSARYYIATLKYSDRDTLRFSIHITRDGTDLGKVNFQQQLFWESP